MKNIEHFRQWSSFIWSLILHHQWNWSIYFNWNFISDV